MPIKNSWGLEKPASRCSAAAGNGSSRVRLGLSARQIVIVNIPEPGPRSENHAAWLSDGVT